MRHWDISVAFTSALPEEPTYVRFPKNIPDDVNSDLITAECVCMEKQHQSYGTSA